MGDLWEYSGTAIAGGWTTRGGANTGGGLSNNAGTSEEPSLALDSSGNSHIAWMDTSGGDLEIYYAYWDGASWVTHGGANTGGGVSNNAGASWRPSLALDSSGNPHIAWEDASGGNFEIYYAYWNGASWVTHGGANTGGGVSNNAGDARWSSLALDSSGNPHIAWEDYSGSGDDYEIYYAYWNGASWVTHGGANTGGGVSNDADDSAWPSLALDSSGNPHIAWTDHSGGDLEIYYAYWDGDSWETYGGANTGGGLSNNADDSWFPSLALDSSGNPHIAWRDDTSAVDSEIYYAYWNGASWVTHGGANTGGGVSNNAHESWFPSLALDSSNKPHIAWQDDSSAGDSEIYYAYWNGASWVTHGGANTGGGLSNNAGVSVHPSLALDSSGNPHIAWEDNSGGDSEIYYRYWMPCPECLVEGFVYYAPNQEPSPEMTIILKRISPRPMVTMEVTTGRNGYYRFADLDVGEYVLEMRGCRSRSSRRERTVVITGGRGVSNMNIEWWYNRRLTKCFYRLQELGR